VRAASKTPTKGLASEKVTDLALAWVLMSILVPRGPGRPKNARHACWRADTGASTSRRERASFLYLGASGPRQGVRRYHQGRHKRRSAASGRCQ